MKTTADRQASHPCDSCGSWYRSGSLCNLCGNDCTLIDKEESDIVHTCIGGKHGRIWSKRKHRYLTEEEVRAGVK